MSTTLTTKFPMTFTLDPLDATELLIYRHRTLAASKINTAGYPAESIKWNPDTTPVPVPARFTITEHPGPVYLVARHPQVGQPDTFGLAETPADALALARVYMAIPSPGRRYGYIHRAGQTVQPMHWTSKNARSRYFTNIIKENK